MCVCGWLVARLITVGDDLASNILQYLARIIFPDFVWHLLE